MTTYTTTITSMYTLNTPEQGFVVNVLFNVSGTDGTNTASIDGNIQFTNQVESDYIPYDQLTEAICVGWCQTSLGKDTVEASLQSQIDALKNPVQESGVPW